MPLTKAILINRDAIPPSLLPVMFNPPEYQLQKSNQFAEVGIPGLGSALLQFVKGGSQTLTLELLFDTTDSGDDARLRTSRVARLMEVNSHTHAPPRLLLVWGTLVFPCILESATQRFDAFNSLGQPVRAWLNATFKGYDALESLMARIPLFSADRAKKRLVKAGDTLQRIAAEEYGDPRPWRLIATANGLDDPLRLVPGQRLAIPTLPSSP